MCTIITKINKITLIYITELCVSTTVKGFKVLLHKVGVFITGDGNKSWLEVGKPCTDWFAILAIVIGSVFFRMEKIFILPIALSAWIHRDAILLPDLTSAGSCLRPSMKSDMLSLILRGSSWSLIVNPVPSRKLQVCRQAYPTAHWPLSSSLSKMQPT